MTRQTKTTITYELRDWSGGPAVVVGGGDSLRGFDWHRLAGRRVVAVNRAWEYLLDVDAEVVGWGIDARFWRWALRHRCLRWALASGLTCYTVEHSSSDPCPPEVLQVRTGDEKADLRLDKGLRVHRHPISGPGAVELARWWGASPVYLLGFDCRGAGHDPSKRGADRRRTSWFHDGYPWGTQPASIYDSIALPCFRRHRADPLWAGHVVNLGPDFTATGDLFPRADLEEVLPCA